MSSGISADEQDIISLVARWVDERARPEVHELEASNTYPEELIEEMKEMGIYGLLIPVEYGGIEVSTECFARVTE